MTTFKKIALISSLFFSFQSFALLNLDSPAALVQKAALSRSDLRDVILTLGQQVPEMRDQDTFESYFFILDQLDTNARDFNLDDIYPGAVKSLGKQMSLFSIKWVDLSLMPSNKLSYYMKWLEIDSYTNLLATTNYLLLTINKTDVSRLQVLATNIDAILVTAMPMIEARPDLVLGYRDMISNVAITVLQTNNLSDSDKDFWFSKIYTTTGLNLYLDLVQKQIYAIDSTNTELFQKSYLNLKQSFEKIKKLSDSQPSWIKEKTMDMSIELIKKSFEFNLTLDQSQIDFILSQFTTKYLQSLSSVLTFMPPNLLTGNAGNLEKLTASLLPLLTKNNLTIEATQLNLSIGKVLATLKINALKREGTYKLTDKVGRIWNFTLLQTTATDFAATLSDSSLVVFKNFLSIKYDIKSQLFTAARSQFQSDTSLSNPVIQFKFKNDQIIIIDPFATSGADLLTGPLTEKVQNFSFANVSTDHFSDSYHGDIKFIKSDKKTKVDLIIQSSGDSLTGMLRDSVGTIYNFNSGTLNNDGSVILNTGLFASTSWAQFRGKILNGKIEGIVIIAGRGISTNQFTLTTGN